MSWWGSDVGGCLHLPPAKATEDRSSVAPPPAKAKPRRRRKASGTGPRGAEDLLPLVRSGRITADEYYRRTLADYERLALAMLRGWDLPASTAAEDVAQLLRMHVLLAMPSWDPERGATLGKFALFRAHSRVATDLHRERQAARGARRGEQPSRYPLLLVDAVEAEEMGGRGRDEWLASLGRYEGSGEARACAAEAVGKLAAALGVTAEELGRGWEGPGDADVAQMGEAERRKVASARKLFRARARVAARDLESVR